MSATLFRFSAAPTTKRTVQPRNCQTVIKELFAVMSAPLFEKRISTSESTNK